MKDGVIVYNCKNINNKKIKFEIYIYTHPKRALNGLGRLKHYIKVIRPLTKQCGALHTFPHANIRV